LSIEKVKLDGIPIPTPICPRTFKKIEEMNPEISINVWEWTNLMMISMRKRITSYGLKMTMD
jgi:hypothetical protein